MAETKRIETVLAKAGNNPAEAVATIGRRSICFLPKGVKPGQEVRVELVELGKSDSRGNPMYRGVPAPAETSVAWLARDGKFERVEFSVDWKLQKTETRVLESRVPAKRDGEPQHFSTFTVDWSQSHADARIAVTTKTEIPELEEQLGSNGPVMVERSRRDGGTTVEEFALESCEPTSSRYTESNDWLHKRFRVSYEGEPQLYVKLKLSYAGRTSETNSQEWSTLPTWLKAMLAAPYPLCGCGQSRFDSAGHHACADCETVERVLPADKRQEIAETAEKLLAVEPLPREAGEIVLKSTLGHVTSEWTRDHILREWTGYAWYYFAVDGVYGSKFPRSALQILRFLPQARGEVLIEFAVWLCGREKADDCERYGDYFVATQIKGQNALRSLTESGLQGAKLAVRLRGSEAERFAAIEGLAAVVAAWGEDSVQAKEVKNLLQSDEQDYARAIAKVQDVLRLHEARVRAIQAGEIWQDVRVNWEESGNGRARGKGWAIAPDGEFYPALEGETHAFGDLPTDTLVVSHSTSDYGYRYTECWTVHKLPRRVTDEQRGVLSALLQEERVYFAGAQANWNLSREGTVRIATAYSRDFRDADAEMHRRMLAQFPIDLGKWFVRTAEDDREGLFLEVWHREVGTPEEEARLEAERQVADGSLLELRFRRGTDKKTGQPQWEAGNKHVKYVLDRYSQTVPVEGLEYFCTPGKVLVDTGTYRVQLVSIVPPLPVARPSSNPPGKEKPSQKKSESRPASAIAPSAQALSGLFGGKARVGKRR